MSPISEDNLNGSQTQRMPPADSKPDEAPERSELDLTIVIVSYNTRDMLRKCLLAIEGATEGIAADVWVVDNNSPDASAAMVAEEFPRVRLIANPDNPGFARANNQALKHNRARHVVILNPDTEPEPGSLTCMARYLDAHSDVGAVGPKLLNTDGSLQHNGRPFPTPAREFWRHSGLHRLNKGANSCRYEFGRDDFDVEWETDQVMGACLMVPRRVMEQVGMLDEDFFMFYEETEWCWRIRRAGYKVAYLPEARVTHHWMGSVRQQYLTMTAQLCRSALVYYRKTARPGAQMAMRGIVGMALAKIRMQQLGVAVKRQLRARKLIR